MKSVQSRLLLALLLLAIPLGITELIARDNDWDLMTRREMGVDRFHEAHPEWNGKGVVIAVLDTGVDMGVAGLEKLPDGEIKVVDCRDFSGEGDLIWEEGFVVPNGDKGEKIVDSTGRSLEGFREQGEGALDGRYYLAFLEESCFQDTSVRDLNSDGDEKDSFGILIFAVKETVKEGEEEHEELRFEAVVDVNGDGDLKDGVRLTDYYRQHQSFVLQGKEGDRRQLTMALNFYPEEKRLSVHFDDGGHGTHVAGIAAGYQVHGQKGYHGMAPGARVISLKIGNNRYAGGCTTTESMVKAYEYGAKYSKDHKVPVVFNMSFGVGSEIEGRSAIDLFIDDFLWKNPGVVVVTSAGNEGPGLSSVGTPACSVRAIAVGALLSPEAAAAQYGAPGLKKEILFSFSSRGGDTNKPDILAPGSACSTVPPWGDRDHMHGTSMASPAAAGAVALVVDALVSRESPFEIDNALILRALKHTGRMLEGWTVLDQGGGVIDVPAAYEYARFLCENGEGKVLREYRVTNRGPVPGQGVAYWRTSPYVPSLGKMMNFRIEGRFPEKIEDEAKARFYRAFDLEPDVDWLSLNKPLIYLKGSASSSLGIMADLEGRAPGLYTGRVIATRRSDDRVLGKPVPEFVIPVTALIPHRVDGKNHGRMRMTGAVEPGFLQRHYVEVPAGITSITTEVRILDGGESARLSVSLVDPEGVGRGFTGASSGGERDGRSVLSGRGVVPGTWEWVVSSSIRSREPASYDLVVTLHGLDVGATDLTFGDAPVQRRLLVPVRCTQAAPFRGSMTCKLDSFGKKDVVEVRDEGEFTRTVTIDSSVSEIRWTVDFDRETYALFTDCVLRIEDVETGKTLRNSALSQRSAAVSYRVPDNLKQPKEYRLALIPAFTHEKDSKHWRFVLTESRTWRGGAINLEPVAPKKGRLSLVPWESVWTEFLLSKPLPASLEGFQVQGVLEIKSDSGNDTIVRKRWSWTD